MITLITDASGYDDKWWAGCAYIANDKDYRKPVYRSFVLSHARTSNSAEMLTILLGLQKCMPHKCSVTVHTDLDYLCQAMNGDLNISFRAKTSAGLLLDIRRYCTTIQDVTFKMVSKKDRRYRKCHDYAKALAFQLMTESQHSERKTKQYDDHPEG